MLEARWYFFGKLVIDPTGAIMMREILKKMDNIKIINKYKNRYYKRESLGKYITTFRVKSGYDRRNESVTINWLTWTK